VQENDQTVNALVNTDAEGVAPIEGEASTSLEGTEAASAAEQTEVQQSEKKSPVDELPEFAKRRLAAQERKHQRELEQLKRTVEALAHSVPRQEQVAAQPPIQVEPGSVQEVVLKTIYSLAEQNKKKAEQLEQSQRIEQLFNDGSKYEDFDDVVRTNDVPISTEILNAALDLPNSADVLYHLGKEHLENRNRSRLKEFVQLSPQQLRRKMIETSVELMVPKREQPAQAAKPAAKPMPLLKTNPTAKTPSSVITEKSSVSDIRKFLKQIKR